LHRNEQARGYTKAANQGLAASSGELAILLNSDTIVTDGWAEKMADAVFSTSGAGIVGPMSNAASHQSIPEHRSSKGQTAINDLPPGLTAEDMNRSCEQWTAVHVLPRVPLVHGFCLGVTREVIEKIGFFDEDSFPKGYGEENDYCFRAANAGFSLVVATHTYVFHVKSKSHAGPERVALMKAGAEALRRLHGRPRIQRAVISMDENPIFVDLRQRAWSLAARNSTKHAVASTRRSTSAKVSHVLAVTPLGSNGHPEGSGYIRVVRPLQHHSLSQILKLSLARYGGEELGQEHDAILIQRDAIRSLELAIKVVKRCQKRKIRLIYEIDDDLFHLPNTHPATARFSPAVKEAMRTIAQGAQAVVVSTAPLRERMTAFNRNVIVVPNALDERLWLPANGPQRDADSDGQVRIVYMGTRAHDDDLALVIDVIRRLTERYGDRVTFTCIGVFTKNPLEMVRTQNVPEWVRRYPDFVKWMTRSCRYDIAIAPLVENDFNRHKSYIKYLDYGVCGFAPVLSNTVPYREVVRHGGNGMLVKNDRESWFESLCALIENPTLRDELGRHARKDVLARHTLAVQAEYRQEIWTEILS
jgi:glycosyltransferase involved in cell wall biosynthesis